jgi:CHAT domain-containing protein/tetratricopeptide (TPR) repeat protein
MKKWKVFLFAGLINLFFVSVSAQSPELVKAVQDLQQTATQKSMTELLSASEKILLMCEKEFGKTDPNYGTMVVMLAGMQEELGLLQQANTNYQSALQIMQNAPAEFMSVKGAIYSGLGSVNFKLSDFSKAEKYFQQAEAFVLKNNGDNDQLYSKILNDIGHFYVSTGNFPKAETYFTKGLEINKRVFGEGHYAFGHSMNNLAMLYDEMGNYEKAATYYEKAIDIWKATLGENHPRVGDAMAQFALLFIKHSAYDIAENMYMKVLDIYKTAYGKKDGRCATIINNLAMVYMRKDDLVKAEQYAQLALDMKKEFYGPQSAFYAGSLSYLGTIKLRQLKFAEAEKLVNESMVIYKTLYGPKRDLSHFTKNLAISYSLQKNPAKASPLFNLNLNEHLNKIDFLFPSLSEQERLMYYQTMIDDFDFFYFFGSQYFKQQQNIIEDIFNYNINTKAVVLNSFNKVRNRILNSGNANLIAQFEQWKGKRDQLSKVWQMSVEDKAKSGINEQQLETEVTDLERKLSLASEEFAKQSDKKRYTWKDIQRKLKPNEAGVQIIRYHSYRDFHSDSVKYFALIVKSTSKIPEVVMLADGTFLEERSAKFYSNAIKSQLDDTRSYDAFWKPFETSLKGMKKVYVCPDGVFNQINFNTLKNPTTKKFLIDDYEIQQVTNLKDLLTVKPARAVKTAKIIGFPDYKYLADGAVNNQNESSLSEGMKREFSGMQIADLPGTQQEISSISEVLEKGGITSDVLTGKAATESALKQTTSPSILHIATHGFFLKDVDISSKATSEYIGVNAEKLKENPLLRSGILLAGAQHSVSGGSRGSENDGILTAYEMMNLNLDNTQLIVLSACETGLGEVQAGEGVYGFQRALIIAGAGSVMMSLWKVDDKVTRELMVTFYQFWMQGNTVRDAFRKAQQKIRESNPDPYYWGAFVLVGD